MAEANNIPTLLGEALLGAIRQAVREEIQAGQAQNGREDPELLTPEELSERLKVPLSWVYEQSHQKEIPTYRIGRYIRFNFREVLGCPKVQKVLASQKKKS